MNRNFNEMLKAQWAKGKFACVGLDSDVSKIPKSVKGINDYQRVVNFNCQIIDATKDLVCAYKPNSAFYEAFSGGAEALYDTMNYIDRVAPQVVRILDIKRADIGNTNIGYVKSAFDRLDADAATVNPYMGAESLDPFLKQTEKGIIVLCRTSNPGAAEFQDRLVEVTEEERDQLCRQNNGDILVTLSSSHKLATTATYYFARLYQLVALRVSKYWNANKNCALVVGATAPKELAQVRKIAGKTTILIPAVGKQGGSVEESVKAGKTDENDGLVVNNSSAIIFASSGDDFAEAARHETQKLHDEIQKHLN